MADTPPDPTAVQKIQQDQRLVALLVLIGLYSAAPFGALLSFLAQIFGDRILSGEAPIVDATDFNRFLSSFGGPNGGLSEAAYKLILPLAAIFVGANLTMLQRSRLARWLFMLPLCGVVAALIAAALFASFATVGARNQLVGLQTMLTEAASNLGVVLMFCVGQAREKKT